MFRVLVAGGIAALLTLTGAAKADAAPMEFQKVTSIPGRFTAEMPGKPEQTTEEGSGAHYFDVAMESPLMRFRIGYLDLEDASLRKDPQANLEMFREGYRQAKNRTQAAFEGDKVITLGRTRFPGREYRLVTKRGSFLRERLFLVGNRIYILFVQAIDKAVLDSREANRFFDAFEIDAIRLPPRPGKIVQGAYISEMPEEIIPLHSPKSTTPEGR